MTSPEWRPDTGRDASGHDSGHFEVPRAPEAGIAGQARTARGLARQPSRLGQMPGPEPPW